MIVIIICSENNYNNNNSNSKNDNDGDNNSYHALLLFKSDNGNENIYNKTTVDLLAVMFPK